MENLAMIPWARTYGWSSGRSEHASFTKGLCMLKFSQQQAYIFYYFQQEFLTNDPFGAYNLQENLEMQIGLQL